MEYKYWLAGIIGISAADKINLTKEANPREIYEMSDLELFSLCEFYNVNPAVLDAARKQGESPEVIMKKTNQMDIKVATILDKEYPRKLRNINQPPFALYYRGQLPKDEITVAIVGSRKCSEYGRTIAEKLGASLGECGVAVISGMAYGIDCAGHAGAMSSGGTTFGVLGCGVDVCYPPEAKNIYKNILEKKGGIVSEYPPGTTPLPIFFPSRNRIISGLSDIVVVVEAKLRSGSLITADFAMDQGRDVYAVPGRIFDLHSQGTNRLIYQGAGILDDIEQFLMDANFMEKKTKGRKKENKLALEKEETLLYSVLSFEPKYLDIIIEETGLTVTQVLALTDSLKRKKYIKETYKNYFSRRA